MMRQRSVRGSVSRGAEGAGAGTCDASTGGGKYCCGSLGPGRRGTISSPGSRGAGAGSSAQAGAAKNIVAPARAATQWGLRLFTRTGILLARVEERRLRALHVAKPRALRREAIGTHRGGRVADAARQPRGRMVQAEEGD